MLSDRKGQVRAAGDNYHYVSLKSLRKRGRLTLPIRGSYREVHYGCRTVPPCVFSGSVLSSMFYLEIRILKLEPRGFELLTSAVQNQVR